MAKENTPNVAEEVKEAASAPQSEAPAVVSKEQYDALLKQAQELVNEANRRIAALENDKKVLKDTLNVQNKLVEKLLAADNK